MVAQVKPWWPAAAWRRASAGALVGLDVRAQPAAGQGGGHRGDVVLKRFRVHDQRGSGELADLHALTVIGRGRESPGLARDGSGRAVLALAIDRELHPLAVEAHQAGDALGLRDRVLVAPDEIVVDLAAEVR